MVLVENTLYRMHTVFFSVVYFPCPLYGLKSSDLFRCFFCFPVLREPKVIFVFGALFFAMCKSKIYFEITSETPNPTITANSAIITPDAIRFQNRSRLVRFCSFATSVFNSAVMLSQMVFALRNAFISPSLRSINSMHFEMVWFARSF